MMKFNVRKTKENNFSRKVALINCPVLELNQNHAFANKPALTIPLGIAYLASYLIKNKVKVSIIDGLGEGIEQNSYWNQKFVLIGLTPEQIVQRIPLDADVIGISANMTPQRKVYFSLIEKIRESHLKKIIVVGGNEATCFPDKYLSKGANYVLLNESEKSLLELVNNLNNKEAIKKIEGIVYRTEKKETRLQPFGESNSDLDQLPFPARELLPLEKYWKKKRGHGPVNRRYTPIISSRGCPFNCTYCSSKIFWKRRWNFRSPENFVAEIEECVNRYGITEFEIEDDNFTLDIERFNQILDLIIEKKLNIKWTTPNGVRSEKLNFELLKKMKKSGCIHLTLAPESGSQKVLKELYNKEVDLNNISEIIKNCKRIGIKTCAFFVVGLPQETREDRQLTKGYVKKLAKLGLDEIGAFPCLPLPKTDLREKYFSYLSEEVIDNDTWIRDIPLWYPHRKEVRRYIQKLYFTFLLTKMAHHPFEVIRSVFHVIKGEQSLKMEREIIRRLKKEK